MRINNEIWSLKACGHCMLFCVLYQWSFSLLLLGYLSYYDEQSLEEPAWLSLPSSSSIVHTENKRDNNSNTGNSLLSTLGIHFGTNKLPGNNNYNNNEPKRRFGAFLRNIIPSNQQQQQQNGTIRSHQIGNIVTDRKKSPICMIQIIGICNNAKFDYLPYYGWFDDHEMGGPMAATEETCVKRRNGWKKACNNNNDNTVEMIYNPSFPVLYHEHYQSQCRIKIMGSCYGIMSMSNTDWFPDETKGGPRPTTHGMCRVRQRQWQQTCSRSSATTETIVDMDYHGLGTKLSDASCRIRIEGYCSSFPSLSDTEWFEDSEKGGPKPTSFWDCRKRKQEWQRTCGSSGVISKSSMIHMEYDGPGVSSDRKQDGSWDIYDIDGSVLNLVPLQYKPNQSCFNMTRTPPLPNIDTAITFCYPTINIAGHPKAGTSFLQFIMAKKNHPQIQSAHIWKEYCRVRNNGFVNSYFRYLYGFAKATRDSRMDQILVNGCIKPEEVMELDVLLKGPKSMSVYLVRDAAERSWATYNYWCDPMTEKKCGGSGWAQTGIHQRSPELFQDEITLRAIQKGTPKKLLIPDYTEISSLYTYYIHMFESDTISNHVHVIASEKMKVNLTGVWYDLVQELKQRTGYNLREHPKIKELEKTRVNQGNDKGDQSVHKDGGVTNIAIEKDGLYAQSSYKPMLDTTRELLTSWWDECNELKNRTSWQYPCHSSGYDLSKKFVPVETTDNARLNDMYITLWLHQVHSWFAEDDHETTKSKVRKFLQEAKDAGFTSVMGDLPWAWTEREAQGDVRIDTFHKDWMETACDIGLSLHVVITMREFPPWVQTDSGEYFEFAATSNRPNCLGVGNQTREPSIAHPQVFQWAKAYTRGATDALLTKYGSCVRSVSPTLNNEYETRYTQTSDMMRDYSTSAVNHYKKWQVDKGIVPSLGEALPPHNFVCAPNCDPLMDANQWNWLGFREEFLAERYMQLCRVVHESYVQKENGDKYEANCLLHIGEIFATTDFLNSNLFYKLGQSEYVDELVMDSNLLLNGAPSSPSIIGILISAAQAYGKIIHYEAATERIVKCNEKGQIDSVAVGNEDSGANLLLRAGIKNALDAGTHSLGVTNLCAPKEIVALDLEFRKVSSFQPTALIYVPYRVFYAWSFVVSGITCEQNPTPCWHPSFDQIDVFGRGKLVRKPGMCPTDVAQHGLTLIWDELRTRHEHVAVIGDTSRLTDDLLQMTTERIILTFPCLMDNSTWHFYEGKEAFDAFHEKAKLYSFREHYVDMPGKCRTGTPIRSKTVSRSEIHIFG